MAALSELLGDLVVDVDGLFLFMPSSSHHEQSAETDVPTVIIAPKNTVKAEAFVELPLQFQNVKDRIRLGVEGAMEQGIVEAGDTIVCNIGTFDGGPDSLVRVRVEENMWPGIYDLFANPWADSGVIRDVFEVAIKLGKKGQEDEPIGALFIAGDAGKVMNKSWPLLYNPSEKPHVYVGDPIVNVMLKESSRLDGVFVISGSGKIVPVYRYSEPLTEGIDIPKGLSACHMAGDAITRDTNVMAIVLPESDRLTRAFKGDKMILEIGPEAY